MAECFGIFFHIQISPIHSAFLFFYKKLRPKSSWVGTSIGLLRLQNIEEPKWEGPFNPADTEEPLNVLFIRDVERGIEISGNYGKRGYEQPIEDIKTYLLPNMISNTDWRVEELPKEPAVEEEIVTP